jgi:hypothetical protein
MKHTILNFKYIALCLLKMLRVVNKKEILYTHESI